MDRIDQSVYERADEGLLRLLEKANVANLTEEEYAQYEASMKALEDEVDMEQYGYSNGYNRGMEDGMEKGREQGREEGIQQGFDSTIKLLYASGMSLKEISERLQISEEQVTSIVK